MKALFENINQAVGYIKYLAEDEPNISVKLYREAGCWYVEGCDSTACNRPPNGWKCARKGEHQGPCAAYPLEIEE